MEVRLATEVGDQATVQAFKKTEAGIPAAEKGPAIERTIEATEKAEEATEETIECSEVATEAIEAVTEAREEATEVTEILEEETSEVVEVDTEVTVIEVEEEATEVIEIVAEEATEEIEMVNEATTEEIIREVEATEEEGTGLEEREMIILLQDGVQMLIKMIDKPQETISRRTVVDGEKVPQTMIKKKRVLDGVNLVLILKMPRRVDGEVLPTITKRLDGLNHHKILLSKISLQIRNGVHQAV